MHPSLHLYQEKAAQFLRTDFELETWANDCQFTEGPVWNEGGYYLFSDITANRIYRIGSAGGKTVFLENSGTAHPGDPDLKPDQAGSNGLAFDRDGSLLICRHGAHELARYHDGEWTRLAGSFDDRPFNSPNDLIVHPDGRIYFSDPPYGLKEAQLNPEKFQALGGVYVWKEGNIRLICSHYRYPNGVCLSPDGRYLYICSSKDFEGFISIYDTTGDTHIGAFAQETSDGMEVDRQGHLYLCTREGILVLDEQGGRMARIELPAQPANCCWGGKEGRDLFITAREFVFCIRELAKPDR